ncbi:hypothetical protein [Corallococcus terminator]|uniref:Uncharacterized protein n=1 Tax=Corallococcus terminator TaxID=2316733 RepID=A0A3A8HNS3_9BACT|nr:hypothetical protein [Corallococcus terminator]RKG66853.1 hypothetical protein D7V88_41365 [Corallococcus terminator]
MFRDDAQRAAVCNSFLVHVSKPPLFTAEGPIPLAFDLLEACSWSSGERAFLHLAWTLWDAEKAVPFMDVVGSLDSRSYALLAGFIAALGEGSPAIDRWLASAHKSRPPPHALRMVDSVNSDREE